MVATDLKILLVEDDPAVRGTLVEVLRHYGYARRAAVSPGRDRSVFIDYELTPARICYRVTDEGQEFDWRALPDCTDPDNLFAGSGRGIVVMRLSMDEVRFNGRGNEITLVKFPHASTSHGGGSP